jgi:hypothetical protein
LKSAAEALALAEKMRPACSHCKYNVITAAGLAKPGPECNCHWFDQFSPSDLARQDFVSGYTERMAGYYDKYYRRTRRDEGAAYDAGCVAACSSGKIPPDQGFTLIECSV